ncbi:MAG: ABC transporter ATP-binding protein [Balneolaceae bacterium]|nr:MAG: ABC transporter ATP-binding protein [Balneolaceae bacterium]
MINLNVTTLSKRFGSNLVFSDLTFSAESSVLGISGSNGSGKSTLLRCLSGLMKPSSGKKEWFVDGKPLEAATLKQLMGFAAPYIQLYEELTVLENLQFIVDIKKSSATENSAKLLEKLGATEFATSHFGELSTGQQQRAKLAAALIHKPQILILDEPGSNLDEKGRTVVEQITERFRNEHGFVLLASNQTHELDLCDRVIHLQNL